MSLVRGTPIVALVAVVACASHAQMIGYRATKGVKGQVAQINPVVARTLGDEAARGAVTGALSELASEQQRELIGAIVETTSEAAARGVAVALSPASQQIQELVDHAMASALSGVDRSVAMAVSGVERRLAQTLAEDSTLRQQLAATAHQMSASAVFGVRDAMADIFPQCTGADRRRCVEREVGELSRAAARGMLVGFVGAGWPILAVAFLAGVLVTLLLARVRSGTNRKMPPRGHAEPAHAARS